MRIHSLPADQLTPEHFHAWSELQCADSAFDSPYFRPEFTQAVASIRGDVEVGLLEQDGAWVGFFPFQRGRRNVALPVGGIVSDFQAVIVRKDVAWDVRQLLQGCKLSAWRFDHLIAAQEPLRPYHWNMMSSPYLDLSQGWEGYQAGQRVLHKYSLKKWMQKSRQAARQAGPLRLEVDSPSPAVFQALVRWKVEQYRRTGVTDVLAFDWTVALLERIRAARGEAFSGMTSALYMGDSLAAVLFSMRSGGVLHSWFSAYNPDIASYSPGIVLFLEIARTFPELGVQRVDLGKGPERYKQQLASGAVELAEGSVDLRPITGMIRRNCHRAYQWVRHSPLRRPLLGPGQFLRRMIESRSYR